MHTRNIAILAHIDAGKTTLSERILLTAGEILRAGNVEDGLATMDYLPEEKEKGITIEAGISPFSWRGNKWNLIDAPGHIDFGIEADSALEAADGAVLVISAVDGIQPQTLSAWEKIRSLNKPCIIFLNKCDLRESRLEESFLEIEEQFGVCPVLLSCPLTSSQISQLRNHCEPQAQQPSDCNGTFDILSNTVLTLSENGKEEVAPSIIADEQMLIWRREAAEAASLADDVVLEKLLAKKNVEPADLLAALKKLFKKNINNTAPAANEENLNSSVINRENGKEHIPCYAGSAKKNLGVRSLLNGLDFFTPSFTHGIISDSKQQLVPLGKIIRSRFFSNIGEVTIFKSFIDSRVSDLSNYASDFANINSSENSNLQFYKIRAQSLSPIDEIFCGGIYGVKGIEIADQFLNDNIWAAPATQYSPLLQMRIECAAQDGWQKISDALRTIERTDPSIKITENKNDGSWTLRAMGAVQFDFILSRLKREFNCDIKHGEPKVEQREMLTKNLPAVENFCQIGKFSVKVKMSVTIAENSSKNTEETFILNCKPQHYSSAEAMTINSTLSEFCEAGVLGKGALRNVKFAIENLEIACLDNDGIKQAIPPPILKKAVYDCAKILMAPNALKSQEPQVRLFAQYPAQFAGAVANDLLARGAKILDSGGDGKKHRITATAPLSKLFTYTTDFLSLTKGGGNYDIKFEGAWA